MRYPKMLIKNSTIGVVAMSAGVGKKIDEYELSINNIKKNGFNIVETESVRVNHFISNTGEVRAKELDSLVNDDNIDMIMCAAGGDFAIEMLPYVNEESIIKNPKWIMGASDPTSLLYYVTTKLDIATMYGHNAGSYDAINLDQSNLISFEYLKGNLVEQKSYSLYESNKKGRTSDGYLLDTPVIYENLFGDVDVNGRMIGGCIDVLKDIIGTKYDGTKEFISKYKEDGIIWYFDNFALSSDSFYRTLIQFREAGWFDGTKAVLVGRVMYPNEEFDLSYQEALIKVFKGLHIPVVFNMDIGHVVPKMTIINGAMCHVISKDGKGSLKFELK